MSNQQVQRVKVQRLAHIGLWATDVAAQARFYRQILGFDLRLPQDGSLHQDMDLDEVNMFLALGDDYQTLGLFNDTRTTASNGRRPATRTPLHHLAFTVETDAELAALAARLKMSGIELTFSPRDGFADPEHGLGDTLWLADPDGNRIEILVAADPLFSRTYPTVGSRQPALRPSGLQNIALRTQQLETMVDFYTEALGFDISDWLLRECAWLRCNNDHHTLVLMQGTPGIEHIGYTIGDGSEILRWADQFGQRQVPILWGPGRHGVGGDLFLRCADAEGVHIELSAELQQYYDLDVTSPPRLWHTRSLALNLWGTMPSWQREEVHV